MIQFTTTKQECKVKIGGIYMNRENLWKSYTEEEKKRIFEFSEEYKAYLDSAKTEREFVTVTEEELKKNGFVNINEKTELKKGDKV